MSKIVSIGTALPAYRHQQNDILHFMQNVYAMDVTERRKLKFLYHQSNIQYRYSVIPDYSGPVSDWMFYPQSENLEPFPSLETRMNLYNIFAAPLSVDAIGNCIDGHIRPDQVTHLITVSCTGMSAPGLDLQVIELMDLPNNIFRTSVNFMGCYAAIHAMKMADAFCSSDKNARILIVCTELCTLHFQKEASMDNIASSLLFGDGSAAMLITPDNFSSNGTHIESFYSEVLAKGKKDMAWELSSSGFLMKLSGYIPELIESDFKHLVERALQSAQLSTSDIGSWCIHPGGKRILEAISRCLALQDEDLEDSCKVLENFGNMSSPTILFVLKSMLERPRGTQRKIFGAAFGPGLTMETFIVSN